MNPSEQPRALLEFFYHWEREKEDQPFLRQPSGDDWRVITWGEAGTIARSMAAALRARKLKPGSRIGILSKNCCHWILADLAITMAGHISVPIFPNLGPAQLREVLEAGEVVLLFAGKLEQWHPKAIPADTEVISFPHYEGNAQVQGESWKKLVSSHPPIKDSPVPDLKALWTILFTSGTTGSPKGVMLRHASISAILHNEAQHHDLGIFQLPEHRFFSFLPLNHVAERVAVMGGCLLTGGTISFGESLETFAKNLQDTQPTVFFAVPRIWTKFQSAILERMPPRRLAFLLSIPLVNTYLRRKIRAGLGLRDAGVILTGAAPTPEPLRAFFARLGIRLREVYGMTETCGACTVTPVGSDAPGSVGKAVASVEMQVEKGTGELLVRMPWLMDGYYKDPEKTAEVIKNGWLHTGDKARIDAEGFVYIIGRVKDSFKTAKGKFVVPGPMEDRFAGSSVVEQVCVQGRGMPQPIALLVLSDYGRTVEREKLEEKLLGYLEEVNKALPRHEHLSTLVVVREEWTVHNELLTPTMKVRRAEIEARYADLYMAWHEHPDKIVWETE